MPSAQFCRLSAGKRQIIDHALFQEFTTHSLADAQVARIVKEAGIARGAFYNYFADLADAYTYLFGKEMRRIHQPLRLSSGQLLTANQYVEQAAAFLQELDHNHLRQLLIFHFTTNAGLLREVATRQQETKDEDEQEEPALRWAVKTLIHQAINDAIIVPAKEAFFLQRLKATLTALLGDDDNVSGTPRN